MEFMIVFNMDVFHDTLDYVQETILGMDDEDEYFAYDVTMNHLAHCRRKSDCIGYLDNRRGPRWAIYPSIMDQLMDNDDIHYVPDNKVDDYEAPSEWINVGVIFHRWIEWMDPRLVYFHGLDIHITRFPELPLVPHLHVELDFTLISHSVDVRSYVVQIPDHVRFLSLSNHNHFADPIDRTLTLEFNSLEYIRIFDSGLNIQVSGGSNIEHIRYLSMYQIPSSVAPTMFNSLQHLGGNIHNPQDWLKAHQYTLRSLSITSNTSNILSLASTELRYNLLHVNTEDAMNIHLPNIRTIHCSALNVTPSDTCRILSLTSQDSNENYDGINIVMLRYSGTFNVHSYRTLYNMDNSDYTLSISGIPITDESIHHSISNNDVYINFEDDINLESIREHMMNMKVHRIPHLMYSLKRRYTRYMSRLIIDSVQGIKPRRF